MSKELTLKRIKEEIDHGNLGKARDRYHGLIFTYPNDLSLRNGLAEVFSKLQYPQKAGLYWYLEENRSQIMEEACRKFEESCGNSSLSIAKALKFKGNIDDLQSPYAKTKLQSLRSECIKLYRYDPSFSLSKRPKYIQRTKRDKLIPYGCAIVMLLGVFFAAIGLRTVFNWLNM